MPPSTLNPCCGEQNTSENTIKTHSEREKTLDATCKRRMAAAMSVPQWHLGYSLARKKKKPFVSIPPILSAISPTLLGYDTEVTRMWLSSDKLSTIQSERLLPDQNSSGFTRYNNARHPAILMTDVVGTGRIGRGWVLSAGN